MTRSRTRFLAYGLIFIGLLILTVGIGYYLSLSAPQGPGPTQLPVQIAGLPLTNLTTGQQAIEEINQLHGKAFELTSGAVGSYGQDNQVIMWVAAATDIPTAVEILVAMRDRIDEGNSPFTPTGELQSGKRTIFILDGLGQVHFYFQSGKQIVWVAADAPLVEKTLQQVVDLFP